MSLCCEKEVYRRKEDAEHEQTFKQGILKEKRRTDWSSLKPYTSRKLKGMLRTKEDG